MKNLPRCIRVPKREGEGIRKRLIDSRMLDTEHKIRQEGDCLDIPVLCDSFDGYESFESDPDILKSRPSDYKGILDFPDWLSEELPNSYDIIGDVAIIKISESLMPYRERIGEAMMEAAPSLRTVMMDFGVKGEFRVRELEKIAGTGTSETVHKEFGIRISVDPSLVYFNPRLATERARTALYVKDGEVIIDMFAGVAPFSLIISKLAHPEVIYAVDLNPEAERFMKANIENNHVRNIVPIIGDARDVVKGLPKADRIIMNLPQSSDDFLDSALESAKKGAVIHMHRVLDRAEVGTFISRLKDRMESLGYTFHTSRVSELKTYSPTMSVFVFDIVKD